MTAKHLISVIIPCYNAANCLPRSIQSVLAQDIPGTEIIVVDDQSEDTSCAVAEGFASRYDGVRLIKQAANSGPAAARNLGLRHAGGRYVCFLDADDEYAPAFFDTVLPLLQGHDELAWISTGIELVNSHRDVHPIQLECMVGSLPSNLIVRKMAADLVGGFPEGEIFRGKGAGEDVTFRTALKRSFHGAHCAERFLRYWVNHGSHFDYFLDRSAVVNGQVVFKSLTPDEANGALPAANKCYLDQIRERVCLLASLRDLDDAFPPLANRLCQAVGIYDQLRAGFESIHGFLHPQEGFALYHWAKHGPGRGAVVEIGSLFGRSTCWLAAGTRAAGREIVVAVDHFSGSPEHQKDGWAPVEDIVQTGTTLPAFRANIRMHGLSPWVDVAVGGSVEIGSTWKGPIRMLFIDGDHSYEATRLDVATWSKHIVPGGIMAFHDVEVWPGVTRLYREFIGSSGSWKEIGKVRTLRIVQSK